MDASNHFEYALAKDRRFNQLADRLVIEWGKGTRSWVQNYRALTKPIVEVRPRGAAKPFPGFSNVLLAFDELKTITEYPAPNRTWHQALSSSSGVYLILDAQSGMQYVGSACGTGGLLSRWRSYVKTVHGGNERLKLLLKERPDLSRHLRFSILHALPLTMTKQEVIEIEDLHKRKLGSRAHGLNSN